MILEATPENIEKVRKQLEYAWIRQTARDFMQDEWSPDKPAFGQDDVTALVVHKIFGGRIILTAFRHDGGEFLLRYFNELPDGYLVDMTHSQYGKKDAISDSGLPTIVSALKEICGSRYEMLMERVLDYVTFTSPCDLGESHHFDLSWFEPEVVQVIAYKFVEKIEGVYALKEGDECTE